mmetsp:Transcript_738/g.1285  ORF Transcript_738/g.1285 Transcript_738/m.1285 type:complete len:373 (-) Transcript_738:73-1191(-)
MMLPAMTDSPPNFLMPRRRPAESRPLREEPPAFLCAMGQLLLFCGKRRRLLNPVVTLNAAFERQLVIHIGNLFGAPILDLVKVVHAGFVQQAFQLRSNARDLLEIVGLTITGTVQQVGRARAFFRSGLGSGCLFSCSLLRRGFLRSSFLFGLLGRLLRCNNRCGDGGTGSNSHHARANGGFHAGLVCARGEDVRHFDQGQLLAMALLALRGVLTATLDVVDELLALHRIDHVGLNSRAFDEGGAHGNIVTTKHQNFVELDRFTGLCCKQFHAQLVAGLNLVLLAACLHDSEHGIFLFLPRPVVRSIALGLSSTFRVSPPRAARPSRNVIHAIPLRAGATEAAVSAMARVLSTGSARQVSSPAMNGAAAAPSS